MNIAFLGLGQMGRVLASHVNAEHDLTVWNRSPIAAKAAADKLVNNLTVAITTQGIVEALRLGHSGGLTSEEVFAAPELT